MTEHCIQAVHLAVGDLITDTTPPTRVREVSSTSGGLTTVNPGAADEMVGNAWGWITVERPS